MARWNTESIPLGRWTRETARPEELRLADQHTMECPLCREPREWTEFLLGPGSPLLVAVCGTCRETRRDEARRLVRMTRAEVRRRVLDTLLKLARARSIYQRKGVKHLPEELAVLMRKFPDRVAAIIGKTFAVMGDSAQLTDDEAISRIRDLLLDLDEGIIDRNKHKRLNRN